MRCPDCRKKVHTDDVYCVWCGAPLHRRIQPAVRIPAEEISPENDSVCDEKDLPVRGSVLLRRYCLLLLPLLLVAAVTGLLMENSRSHPLPEPTVLSVPENGEILDLPLAQWEGFTLHGDYLVFDEATGALEILFTANNRSSDTILCSDPLVLLEGYPIRGSMYLELPPKKTATGSLRIETEPLQSVGCSSLRELIFSLDLFHAGNGSVLHRTEPVSVVLHQTLPQRDIRRLDAVLLEEAGLSAWLTGVGFDEKTGEMRLYIRMENPSREENFLYFRNIRWEGTAQGNSSYHSLPPGTGLLTGIRLSGIPSGTAGQLLLEMETGGGMQTCVLSLTAEGMVCGVT